MQAGQDIVAEQPARIRLVLYEVSHSVQQAPTASATQPIQLGRHVGRQVHPADHRGHQIVGGGQCQQSLGLVFTGDRLHEHGGSHWPAGDSSTYRIV